MIASFFNNVLNTLVRQLDTSVRLTIAFVFIVAAVYFLMLSIRVKNDKAPLSLGWFILTFVCIGIGLVYILL